MNNAVTVGAKNGEVFYSCLRCVLNIGQRLQMVNLAIVAGCAAVSPAEGKTTNLAIERCC